MRPTSLNPHGDWWPHADNSKPETEDRLVQSLKEILHVAEDIGVDIVLEAYVTTTLNAAETVRRVIELPGLTEQCASRFRFRFGSSSISNFGSAATHSRWAPCANPEADGQ